MSSVTIFDIKRFAVHDGPGIRTTVFLKGCPLDCWWCHNPESRKEEPEEVTYVRTLGDTAVASKKTYGKSMLVSEVMKEILKDKLFFEESGGGVSFSGGEPLYQLSALTELLTLSKKHGLHTTVDTCGYEQWSGFEKILDVTDLILFDLKLIDPGNHKKFTGVANDRIIRNLQKLIERNATIELRIPVVPGVNNSAVELQLYKDFLKGNVDRTVKINLLPYHTIGDNKYTKLKAENRMKGLVNIEDRSVHDFESEFSTIGFDVKIGG